MHFLFFFFFFFFFNDTATTEIYTLSLHDALPIAFAHKGGVHVAAMRRSASSYQHIDPALVGNASRVVVSELSGRGNVLAKAEEYGVGIAAGAEARVLDAIKAAEARGFSYEA